MPPQCHSRMAKPGLREEEEHSDVHANGQVAFLPLFFPSPMAGWLST